MPGLYLPVFRGGWPYSCEKQTGLQRRAGIPEHGGGTVKNTKVTLAGVELKNPVMTASGTFGSGAEYSEFYDLSALGAVVTKGVANVPWPGNPTPRIAETASGMLNAIGLQNPGIDVFVQRDIPYLRKFDTKIVVNVCGKTVEDYCRVVERLAPEPVDLLEINVSCPNVKEGGIAFGQDPHALEEITKEVKKHAKQPIIMKLSPNVTDIAEMARAAEAGGADALSLINTLTGMKIDIYKKSFALANRTGGLSGPAIKPVAVRMVYQTAQAVKLPVIGMGGICTAEDALEFILAGATAVSVGTANFADPYAAKDVAEGIERYMDQQGVEDIRELIGAVR
ncbi:MAG TPA: dihydroorotate dehydrogenase [Candidatus Choladocola avistercoris]|nr:dihydroorotate dehydrogenase [Candidatus Choladocola avistercoris]